MKLPPLECLFTVEEEIGLVGAFNMDGSMVKGRTMLNLVSRGVNVASLVGTKYGARDFEVDMQLKGESRCCW